MEQDVTKRLESLEKKIDVMQQTMNSLRWYFKVSLILTVIFFVLPLLVALIAVPFIMSTFSGLYGGLI